MGSSGRRFSPGWLFAAGDGANAGARRVTGFLRGQSDRNQSEKDTDYLLIVSAMALYHMNNAQSLPTGALSPSLVLGVRAVDVIRWSGFV